MNRLLGPLIRATVKLWLSPIRIDFDNPAPLDEEEDEETLAAINEGIRDAEAGRTVPIEEVRRLLRAACLNRSFPVL